jgi:hypothetical protein
MEPLKLRWVKSKNANRREIGEPVSLGLFLNDRMLRFECAGESSPTQAQTQ